MASRQINARALIVKAVQLASLGEPRQATLGGPVERRYQAGRFGVEFVRPDPSGTPGRVTVQIDRWEVFRAALMPGFEGDLSKYELHLLVSQPEGWRERFIAVQPQDHGARRQAPSTPVN